MYTVHREELKSEEEHALELQSTVDSRAHKHKHKRHCRQLADDSCMCNCVHLTSDILYSRSTTIYCIEFELLSSWLSILCILKIE